MRYTFRFFYSILSPPFGAIALMKKKTAQPLKPPSNKHKAQPGPMLLVQALARILLSNCDSVEHPCKQYQLFPTMLLPSCSTLREQRSVLKVCHGLISMNQVLLKLILCRTSTRSWRVPLACAVLSYDGYAHATGDYLPEWKTRFAAQL